MTTRLDLHNKLLEVFDEELPVYFQPPESIKMTYPCVVYNRRNGSSRHANNKRYIFVQEYDVTIIDKDADSRLPVKLLMSDLPYCRYDRHWTADNLHHDNFVVSNIENEVQNDET